MSVAGIIEGSCPVVTPSTTRTSWMANKAIADSIIMNKICRNLLPPVEPKVRSIEVGLTRIETLRILNTIKPVTKVFTAMDKGKLVNNKMFCQELVVKLE